MLSHNSPVSQYQHLLYCIFTLHLWPCMFLIRLCIFSWSSKKSNIVCYMGNQTWFTSLEMPLLHQQNSHQSLDIVLYLKLLSNPTLSLTVTLFFSAIYPNSSATYPHLGATYPNRSAIYLNLVQLTLTVVQPTLIWCNLP